MNPARSVQETATFSSFAQSARVVSATSSSVDTVETTSTSFITGAGLKKCIPMTSLGRPVTRAQAMIGSDDVVVARIAPGLQISSRFSKRVVLIARSSAIASTTMSTSFRSSSDVGPRTRPSTSEDVAETTRAICAKVGKVAVSCADRAGFIVNALLFPYLNDAVKMLEAHYASADDIDTAMKYGCALPMGPFELLDVVGNDVSLAIQRELYLEFREPGFAPAPLLEHLVTAGYLGRKTGRGFRDDSAR